MAWKAENSKLCDSCLAHALETLNQLKQISFPNTWQLLDDLTARLLQLLTHFSFFMYPFVLELYKPCQKSTDSVIWRCCLWVYDACLNESVWISGSSHGCVSDHSEVMPDGLCWGQPEPWEMTAVCLFPGALKQPTPQEEVYFFSSRS